MTAAAKSKLAELERELRAERAKSERLQVHLDLVCKEALAAQRFLRQLAESRRQG